MRLAGRDAACLGDGLGEDRRFDFVGVLRYGAEDLGVSCCYWLWCDLGVSSVRSGCFQGL